MLPFFVLRVVTPAVVQNTAQRAVMQRKQLRVREHSIFRCRETALCPHWSVLFSWCPVCDAMRFFCCHSTAGPQLRCFSDWQPSVGCFNTGLVELFSTSGANPQEGTRTPY